ncbi:hypothetical protein G8S49_01320 [Clostridium botulinum C]|uniref:Uncharacterized protein n=2 Tax=Clostridium botulinum TaxID=1491 RepID=A0A9Q4XX27_CLOBO|nr:hypothetical protein [Clostridium botulinum]EGO86948.1 hypothetical protein CBCST_14996 [Clostridium botulinum C str. Stockholm]MCD3194216.1 hypothetical protein [Clostridium botulinum C]MCD3199155.1 hypothetical protein [Clostridium botulinum C]MCD3204630.1 hypothetical protein [Clostridium botulinum C]MCD3207973.1 hypothetical protein [Clostridium botulinum C]
MIKRKYDADAEVSVTEIDTKEQLEISGRLDSAILETEEGISKPVKFILVDLTDKNNVEVIIHNLDSMEKQEACEVLEKMIFGETYDHLEENSIRVEKPEYTDFDH